MGRMKKEIRFINTEKQSSVYPPSDSLSFCSTWLVLAFSRLDKNSCSLVTDVDIGEFIEVEEDTFVEQADNPMIVATEIAMKLLFI